MILLLEYVCLAALLHQPSVQASISLASLMTTSIDQQNEIVNKHNQLRRGVKPTASNMLKMKWDFEAAQKAQSWANQDSLEHSSPENRRKKNGMKCGENLFMSSKPVFWSEVIQAWYDEVCDFEYGSGAKHQGAVIGHYTQVVWYKSVLVGCAVSFKPKQPIYKWFYVCHYCPAGNRKDLIPTPYSTGKPCEACPDACDNGLCTNPCMKTDSYSNCPELKKTWSCDISFMKSCKASCECTTEIK